MAKVKSVETLTFRRHEELFNEVKNRHAEEITVWKETSRENADSLTNDVKIG